MDDLRALLRNALDRTRDGREPDAVGDPRVADAARRLADSLPQRNDAEHLPDRQLLGWTYYHRHRISGAGGDGADLERAIVQFAFCLIAGSEPLPPDVLPLLANEVAPGASAQLELAVNERDPETVGAMPVIWQRIVDATPEDDPEHTERLASLGIAGFLRFETFGDPDDLTLAETMLRGALRDIDLSGAQRARHLVNLANVLSAQYVHLGRPSGLDGAIAALQEASGLAGGTDLRVATLATRSDLLRLRFDTTEDPADIAEAIRAAELALQTSSDSGSGHRPGLLMNLANALHDRHRVTADPADLDRAIDHYREAAGLRAPEDPRTAGVLSNLGLALRRRYATTGNRRDLDDAVESGWAAAESAWEADVAGPATTIYLDALAGSLNMRWELTGDSDDLDQLITVSRLLAVAVPEGDPERPARLLMLGGHLHLRFIHGRSAMDLMEAVEREREALDAVPAGHPARPYYCFRLGVLHLDRYWNARDPDDLHRAVPLLEDAERTDWSGRPMSARYLGAALAGRFSVGGDPDDLDRGISLLRAAFTAEPGMSVLDDLAQALLTRFEAGQRLTDLDEVLAHARTLLAGTDQPDEGRRLGINVSAAAARRFRRTGDPDDLALALEGYRAVLNRDTASPAERIKAGRAIAILLAGHDPAQAAASAARAVRELARLAPQHLEPEDRQRELREIGDVAGYAAVLALNDPSVPEPLRARRALEMLESGRAILLSQGIEFRTDPAELAARRPDLADQLSSLRRTLRMTRDSGALGMHWMGDFADNTLRNYPDPVQERRSLGGHYTALMEQIRAVDGLASFAKAPLELDLPAVDVPGDVVVLNVSRLGSHALLFNGATVTGLPLPDLGHLAVAQHVTEFQQAITAAADPAGSSAQRIGAQRTITASLTWLWNAMARPVLAALGHHGPPAGDDWPRVWWSPGGMLGNLPIHAAGDYSAGGNATGASVLDRVVSSYTPTIRALGYARARVRTATRPGTPLIVAMPTTPGMAGRLGFVEEEARIVRRALPGARLLIEPEPGTDAADDTVPTRRNVLDALDSSSIVHFACHGYSHPTDAGSSTLLLHDHQESPLTVGALAFAAPREGDLAYLSACETASVADHEMRDQGIHLTSAFTLAGYASVIGTLWPVDDAVAKRVAEGVYSRMAEPDGTVDTAAAARILHEVTRAVRAEFPALPSLWAAHVHAGG
jgi:hypothetical protein